MTNFHEAITSVFCSQFNRRAYLLIILISGCGNKTVVDENPADALPEISETQAYDFGRIVRRKGSLATHEFNIPNNTSRPIIIVELENRKTCCGDVEITGPNPISPGAQGKIKVILKTNSTLGPISHFCTVKTDDPDNGEYKFWTSATILPDLRITPKEYETPKLSSGEKLSFDYQAISLGSDSDPPYDLDLVNIRCDVNARWSGPASVLRHPDGVIEKSRSISIEYFAEGKPSHKENLLGLTFGESLLIEYPLRWEIASVITATPPGVIVNGGSGRQSFSVLIRSRDNEPFGITQVEGCPEGIGIENSAQRATSHTIKIMASPNDKNIGKNIVLKIETDHPRQASVPLRVCIIGGSLSAKSVEAAR